MADDRGFFARLFRRRPPPSTAPAPRPEPAVLRDEDDAWLEQLVIAAGDGKRHDELAGPDALAHLDALWKGGRERLATEWMEKLISLPEAPADAVATLRARLVDRLDERRELERGLAHLEALTASEPHALRAHYLLAEHHRKLGDDVLALRHYEAVLARDLDYPNVRARVERLRAARGLAAPAAGETIAGADVVGIAGGARYRLVRELGRGATGVVYLARDAELERDVAVKLLHPHLAAAQQQEALGRFFHEARVMASLRHPNVVAVLDLEEKARRIVLELAAGGTLRDLLRERGPSTTMSPGPRSLRRTLERHAQLLTALVAAHRRGIVHRDVKPGNLMFRRDPDTPGVELMLGDFGVAHLPDAAGAVGAAAARSRRPAEAVGTLAYMSPEQRRGEPPRPADDIWAVAVVLFEVLTGRHPWSRDVLLAGARTTRDFELPADALAGVPPALAAALAAHLRRLGDLDPEARPAADAALAEAYALRADVIAAA
ncbi:MAG: serine/threonine protein kinase [Kofleriaceae bacterium]|nr:serine/threonine protein kinase [Kofleriaceae bacterium]MCL4222910.1 serine/threonine protein kinase [Myxococcales bacterium]